MPRSDIQTSTDSPKGPPKYVEPHDRPNGPWENLRTPRGCAARPPRPQHRQEQEVHGGDQKAHGGKRRRKSTTSARQMEMLAQIGQDFRRADGEDEVSLAWLTSPASCLLQARATACSAVWSPRAQKAARKGDKDQEQVSRRPQAATAISRLSANQVGRDRGTERGPPILPWRPLDCRSDQDPAPTPSAAADLEPHRAQDQRDRWSGRARPFRPEGVAAPYQERGRRRHRDASRPLRSGRQRLEGHRSLVPAAILYRRRLPASRWF